MDWLSLGKIIWIDVLLSGDNALVIAMACVGLPRRQRFAAMVIGTPLAVLLRIFFTGSAAYLMTLPYLRLCGGAALLYVAVKLLIPDGGDSNVRTARSMARAIMTIVIADISMSIDNVIAVAAAANGSVILLSIGLVISIPFVIGGASLISKFIEGFPVMLWAGAAMLGWIAGKLIIGDPVVGHHFATGYDWYPLAGALGGLFVLGAGSLWRGTCQNA